MVELIIIALGALIWRLKGGLLDDLLLAYADKHPRFAKLITPIVVINDQGKQEISNAVGRSLWSAFVTALYFNEYPLISPLIFAMACIGCAAGYFKGQFSIAIPENQNRKNYFWLTLRGMFTLFPLAAFLSLLGDHSAWGGVIAGALFVPAYKAGLYIEKKLPFQIYTQWGEILYGAAIIAGVIYG